MKVLCLNNQSGLLGGSEAVFQETSEMLRELGHEVVSVTAYSSDRDLQEHDYCFDKHGIRRLIFSIVDPGVGRKLRSLIAEFQPDIIHAHIFYGGLTYSIVNEIKRSSIPSVWTLHEYKLLCPVFTMVNGLNEVCDKCSDGSFYHAVLNRCKNHSFLWSAHSALDSYVRRYFYEDLNQFDRYVFVSKFARDLHLRYRPDLRARSAHIYNPIPVGADKTVAGAKSRSGFLYVGRLSHEKGLGRLVEAVSKIIEAKLTIVGDGPLRRILENLTSELGVTDRVEFLGFVDRARIPEIMAAHRFLVIPSEWYENNPMSLLESLASGLPAIGSRIGGIPELIQDGRTGRLFEPCSVESLSAAVKWAVEIGDAEWSVLSRNAQRFAIQNMGRERYIDEISGLYSDILSTGSHSPT